MMTTRKLANSTALRKLWRFARLYGLRRSVFKAAGRLRRPVRLVWRQADQRDIAVIGCGQFAFSTIGFFLSGRFGGRIATCLDPVHAAASSFAATYNVPHVAESDGEIFSDLGVNYVYIASNHASHTEYAVKALASGKVVYVEKPVSVSFVQFKELRDAVRRTQGSIFAGYNRPFSQAIADIKVRLGSPKGPLSLSCFVSGHVIGPDHWYRRPEEGTRICGNAGHWIDLFVHLLNLRGIPDHFEFQLLAGSRTDPDDNFSLAIRSSAGDIFSLVLSSRTEPFEGINETINLQWDKVIAKIDDFRRLTLWEGESTYTRRFWPKDVGHRNAVLQPFSKKNRREWAEVEASTALMLRVADMVRRKEPTATFVLSDFLTNLAPAEELQ